ncbi:MAG TPA: TA system VapC family ribonuclease toxin [Acidobacteriaceae bacterium]
MPEAARFLLDVNVLVALTARGHVHHALVKAWFYASPGLRWAACAFTEAGFLRNATASRAGQVTMGQATAILRQLARHPGYTYLPITESWETLSAPFARRVYGTKQVTDAYLLGLALREGCTLVTMDTAIVHLAGVEHKAHLLLLAP